LGPIPEEAAARGWLGGTTGFRQVLFDVLNPNDPTQP